MSASGTQGALETRQPLSPAELKGAASAVRGRATNPLTVCCRKRTPHGSVDTTASNPSGWEPRCGTWKRLRTLGLCWRFHTALMLIVPTIKRTWPAHLSHGIQESSSVVREPGKHVNKCLRHNVQACLSTVRVYVVSQRGHRGGQAPLSPACLTHTYIKIIHQDGYMLCLCEEHSVAKGAEHSSA